jgi:hypothetical protein
MYTVYGDILALCIFTFFTSPAIQAERIDVTLSKEEP